MSGLIPVSERDYGHGTKPGVPENIQQMWHGRLLYPLEVAHLFRKTGFSIEFSQIADNEPLWQDWFNDMMKQKEYTAETGDLSIWHRISNAYKISRPYIGLGLFILQKVLQK